MACDNAAAVLLSALLPQLERSPDALGTRNAALSFTSAVACILSSCCDASCPTADPGPASPPV